MPDFFSAHSVFVQAANIIDAVSHLILVLFDIYLPATK